MPICVEADAYTDKNLEEMVDEDLDRFNTFFQSLGNDALAPFEKAAIKTYLFYKLRVEKVRVQPTSRDDQSGP